MQETHVQVHENFQQVARKRPREAMTNLNGREGICGRDGLRRCVLEDKLIVKIQKNL